MILMTELYQKFRRATRWT